MNTIIIMLAALFSLLLIDRLFLFLESKGLIYWRKSDHKPRGIASGMVSSAVMPFKPTMQHTVAEQQYQKQRKHEQGDREKLNISLKN